MQLRAAIVGVYVAEATDEEENVPSWKPSALHTTAASAAVKLSLHTDPVLP